MIFQNDIFGKQHKTQEQEQKSKSAVPSFAAAKKFRHITIADGLDEVAAANEAMLIHRILQRKLFLGQTKMQREMFLKVFRNEIDIKTGKTNAATAVRDSLLTIVWEKIA